MRAMLEFNQINWVFFSGEQSEEEITGRFMKMLGLVISDTRDIEIYKSKTAHIFIEDGDIAVQDYPIVVKALEARENERRGTGTSFKIRGIGVDYLQNLSVYQKNQDLRSNGNKMFITGETERLVEAAKVIKKDSRANKYCVFMISQIKLQMSEDGNTPLKKSDTKGSAAIINMSDGMVGFHRPHKSRAGLVDDVVTLNLSKNRHGMADITIDYKWKPNRLLISGEIHMGEISHLPRKEWR